jgi:GTPase
MPGDVPVLAVVGRPNVGKSTLVNRILGSRQAVVEDVPGVTRDRVAYDALWRGRSFTLVDTGGWAPAEEGSLAARVTDQAKLAVEAADAVLFVVDATVGVTDADEQVAAVLRRSGKPVVVAANKVDDAKAESDATALWSLGLGEPVPVSALHGRGSGDLLDLVLDALPDAREEQEETGGPRRVALLGRPNTGKSSLLNKLAGHQRSIVDAAAGTTRDPVDELIELGGTTWRFVDTAGIRRRFRENQGADYYAALRTAGALDRAEVAVVLIDASEPLTEQDLRIVSMVIEAGRALVIAYNKWDMVDAERQRYLEKEIDRQLHTARWAPRVNISAATGRHTDRLVPAIEQALAGWETRVPTGRLNAWLTGLIAATPPPVRGGRQPRVLFATQAGTRPPHFVLFSSGFLEASYRRFVERKLREEFGFEGSPVQVSVRVKAKRERPGDRRSARAGRRLVDQPPPSVMAEDLLDLDRRHVWHPYASMPGRMAPLVVESASGVRLRLADGTDLVDGMSSWWAAIHGYRHPVLDAAAAGQLGRMSHVMFGGLTHDPAVRLCSTLASITPAGLEHVFLCDSGSVSVEVAIKMCLQYWRSRGRPDKRRLLTWRGGYHGDTFMAMSVCDPEGGMHSMWAGVLSPQVFADAPPAGYDAGYAGSLAALIRSHADTLAAVIVEPVVQGAGGMRFHDPGYLAVLRAACDAHDVLLIFDEIATGFGRTGSLFAAELGGVRPDVMCVGKALTGGYLSLAAALCTASVAAGISAGDVPVLAHGPTFMGNPLACAVALASLSVLLDGYPGGWAATVARISAGLSAGLAPAAGLPGVADVRVLGAIGVIQLDRDVDIAAATKAAVAAGVWLRPFRDLIYTMPPYVCSDADVAAICAAMIAAVRACVWLRSPPGEGAPGKGAPPVNAAPVKTAPVKKAPGGAGEGLAVASVTGLAPAANRTRSSSSSTRPGIGSAAQRRTSSPTGSGRRLAARTRLPKRRPRSTAASASRQACGNTVRTVATCARACASGGPSDTLTAKIPAADSTLAASVTNSAEVMLAGVCAASNTSVSTTSKEAGRSVPSAARASPMRTRMRDRGGNGSCARTRSMSAASRSTASWPDPGRVTATYRASVSAPAPRCSTRSGPDSATSTRWPSRRMYSNSRYRGSSRSTWECGTPSMSSIQALGRSRSRSSSAWGIPAIIG